jgi:hypothetical protein
VKRDHVESYPVMAPLLILQQEVLRGAHHSPLFARPDGRGRPTEGRGAALANLDEDQRVAREADKIDFPALQRKFLTRTGSWCASR